MFFVIFLYFTFISSVEYYVSQTGSDPGNNCQQPTTPCQTLSHVISTLKFNTDETISITSPSFTVPTDIFIRHSHVLTLQSYTTTNVDVSLIGSIFFNSSSSVIIKYLNIEDVRNPSKKKDYLLRLGGTGFIVESKLRFPRNNTIKKKWVVAKKMVNVELSFANYYDEMLLVDEYSNCNFLQEVVNIGYQIFDHSSDTNRVKFTDTTFLNFELALMGLNFTFENSHFKNMTGTGAPALMVQNGYTHFIKCDFNGNYMEEGTLVNIFGGEATFDDCTFSENTAFFHFAAHGGSKVILNGGSFTGNGIEFALFMVGDVDLLVNKVSFSGNYKLEKSTTSKSTIFEIFNHEVPERLQIVDCEFDDADVSDPFICCDTSVNNPPFNIEFGLGNAVKPYILPISCKNCTVQGKTCTDFSAEYGKKKPVPTSPGQKKHDDDKELNDLYYALGGFGGLVVLVTCCCCVCIVGMLCVFLVICLLAVLICLAGSLPTGLMTFCCCCCAVGTASDLSSASNIQDDPDDEESTYLLNKEKEENKDWQYGNLVGGDI